MIGNLNLFFILDKSVQTDITLGNNVQVNFFGKCIVGILTKQGERKIMSKFYYVEGAKHNFLIIGQLIQKGYRVYKEDNYCVIKYKHISNQLIAKVPMKRNRLFPLRIVPYMKGKKNT